MSVKTINILNKLSFDFSALQGTSLMCFVALRSVDLTQCENAEVLVRVHERAMTGDTVIGVQIVPVSITAEDPAVDFRFDSGATTAEITPTSPATVPGLVIRTITKPFGSHVQVQVKGLLNTAGPETIQATISADLVLKSR